MSERTEKSKYKIPILSDRDTDLTKINPKMWWEQISEYIHLTYDRNLDEITEEGIEYMDQHTAYHIKGDVIWALGPKAKHEIMRGQWGRELKDVRLPELLTLFKKTFLTARNVFHSRAQFFNKKQEENETLDEYWKRLVDIERKCDFNNVSPEEKAEREFAMDLPMLVEETAQNTKILDAIIALETGNRDGIFYPYRPHREHLETRFGLLFYNDRIVIPEAMRPTIITMLHNGHVSINKMDKSAEAFWWPGIHREIRDKAENCPSCRTAGKNLKTQIPQSETNRLEILNEPGQEIQLDLIKSKSRGNVYILVAIDRFSKWPTAQICKNTDSQTVIKFLIKYCADNGTPQIIRTDNGSCFKSKEFKDYCNSENISRIRCTPNLHTGTGLVERTIRTIKSLTRANLEDNITFEESVNKAIKTFRQKHNIAL